MTYAEQLDWDGDAQFAINDIEVNDLMLEAPELVVQATVKDAVSRGLDPMCGVTLASAALGPCSRCGGWTRWRRVMAFEPSDPQAFGAKPGKYRTFYFSICAGCNDALSNIGQRQWAKTRATEMATSIIGADGPKQ